MEFKRSYNITKINRKPRNDKGIIRVNKPTNEKFKLNLIIYGNSYNFKKITDVKKLYSAELNKIQMTESIKYVLNNTYILRRLCDVINGLEVKSLSRPETRFKYLGDTNLRIIPLSVKKDIS